MSAISLAAFAARLHGIARALANPTENRSALQKAGELVVKEAQGALGTYKYGWPRLHAKTVERKRTGDSPLLETGGLRSSYKVQANNGETVRVGSTDPKATWQELGTATIPPRPVMVPATQAVEKNGVVPILRDRLLKPFG